MFAPNFNPAFFANSGSGSTGAFDPAALLAGIAQSDLPSLVNDIFLNLAAAAASHAPAQDEPVISPDAPSSSSSTTATSAKDAAPAKSSSLSTVRRPRLDLSTTASSPSVTAVLDLPGFAKSDVSIAVQPGKLVVSAERQSTARSQSAKPSDKGKERDASDEQPEPVAAAPVQWSVRERQTDIKWVRELPLAAGVKPSEIKASMADGVLTIVYPKQAAVNEDQRVLIE